MATLRIYGEVYCDYRDEMADCGDIYFINSVTGDTSIACVSDNGEHEIYLNEGKYDFLARVVRKDGTTTWYQSGWYDHDGSGGGSHEQDIDANTSGAWRNVCDCEN